MVKRRSLEKGFENKPVVQQNTTSLISMCTKEGIKYSLQINYFPHWMDPLLTMSINKEDISARALFWSKSVCKKINKFLSIKCYYKVLLICSCTIKLISFSPKLHILNKILTHTCVKYYNQHNTVTVILISLSFKMFFNIN